MPAPPISDVKAILSPHHDLILQVFQKAWKRWEPLKASVIYDRTRACLIHDFAVQEAKRVFARRPGVNLIERDETLFVIVDRRVMFRFKKADESGLSRNSPTGQALLFADPDQQMRLPDLDIPDVWRVDVVYVLNALATKIDRVAVVTRDNDRVDDIYEIASADPAAGAEIERLPRSPSPPSGAGEVIRLPDLGGARRTDQGKE